MKALLAAVAILLSPPAYAETCIASVYGGSDGYCGSKTANGERVDCSKLTAAHKKMVLGSMAKVTNLSNGRTIIVRINDRGPFVAGRCIDLTPAGEKALGFDGLAKVTVDPYLPNHSWGQ